MGISLKNIDLLSDQVIQFLVIYPKGPQNILKSQLH